MRKIEKLNADFKSDLSYIELMGIEMILTKLRKRKVIADGTLLFSPPSIESYGFAYTSSSSYAMHNVTSEIEIGYDSNDMPIILSHFAITENNMLIMVGSDVYEHEHYWEVEY